MSETEGSAAAGRITGLGGIFFKSPNTAALAGWYREILGIGMEDWDGAMFPTDAPGIPPFHLWSPFKDTTDYFEPSQANFMINFAVDDLDAFVARLEAKGIDVLNRIDDDSNGKFAWIMDPDGNKLELWEPKAS